MKTILSLFSETGISALGWTLVHSLWQGSLIALAASIAWYVLRKRQASLRYNVGVGLLVFQVLASSVTFLYYFSLTKPATQSVSAATSPHPYSVVLNSTQYELSLITKVQLWIQIHMTELVVCWFIGALILMVRFAAGWIYTERLRSQSSTIVNKEWRERFDLLAARLNVPATVDFRENARILTPMVIGAFKPVVLLPIGFLAGFPVSQVEAIIAHELAHVRRNDYLINMIQSVIEVVYFFHPALWWLSERVRTERENACDDIALGTCENKMTLAHALVKVAEWQSAPSLAMAFASKKPLLLQRVRRVLGVSLSPSTPNPVMLVVVGLIIGISFYSNAQKEEKAPKKSNKVSEIKAREKSKSGKQTFADTIISAKVIEDSSHIIVAVGDQRDSLAQFYHNFNSDIVSIAEIRSSLNVLTDNDISLLSNQMATLGNYGKIDMDKDGNVTRVTTVNNYSTPTEDDYAKIRARIAELQVELDKLRFEAEKAGREREKNIFDGERAYRELEKIEWAKQKASLVRSELTAKRSALLREDGKKGSSKLTDTEIEKLLAEYEEKIKSQELKLTDYNTQLSNTRLETLKAEAPLRETEKAIEVLEHRMEVIHEQLEAESQKLQKLGPPPPPQMRLGLKMAPPPPPAEPKPAIRAKKSSPALAPPPPPSEPKPAAGKTKKAVPSIAPPPPPVPAKVK